MRDTTRRPRWVKEGQKHANHFRWCGLSIKTQKRQMVFKKAPNDNWP